MHTAVVPRAAPSLYALDPAMPVLLRPDGTLPVRVRDGIGLVGPLVIPGVTSCLGNP
jgi:hypothetical protein